MRSWFAEGEAMFARAREALLPNTTNAGHAVVVGNVLAREGWFNFHLGRSQKARALLEQSLALLRPLQVQTELVFPLNYLAVVCSYLGETALTYSLCHESLQITTATGDQYGRAIACNILGQTAYEEGAYDTAKEWCQQSLILDQRSGNRWSMAYSVTTLGKVAYVQHDYAEARRLFEQSLAIRQETHDLRGIAICFTHLGDTAVQMGDYKQAGECYKQSLSLCREIGNQWGITTSLIKLGELALVQQRSDAATRILQEALRLAVETQTQPQVHTIYTAFAKILRKRGDAATADTLLWKIAHAPSSEADYRNLPAAVSAHSNLTLEQAIEDATAVSRIGPLPEQVRRADSPIEPGWPFTSGAATSHHTAKASFPAGLTAREVDVLRLVARGMRDKEVADALDTQ